MKLNCLIIILIAALMTGSACSRKTVVVKRPVTVNKLPPGQAKKVTGSQSARPYAPGQQKKRH